MLTYTTRPLSDRSWLRPEFERAQSRFRGTTWSQNLAELERELDFLDATDVVIECDIRADQIRRDGMIRANAVAGGPGVVLAFESKYGPLMYRCDRYGTVPWGKSMDHAWQHNLRAIVLTMDAQRTMERHGAAETGQQYTGWAVLSPGPSADPDRSAAAEYLRTYSDPGSDLLTCYRRARRVAHPDAPTGSKEAWERVEVAGQLLGLKS